MTARRGFTLLETAIVLAITAIGALLVLPLWPTALRAPAADDTPGGAIAQTLSAARQQAIGARQDVLVYVDVRQQRLRMDTVSVHGRGVWQQRPLPLAPNELLVTSDTTALVHFHSSGAAQSTPMALRHAAGWLSIVIDPWSGEVIRVARQ